MDKLYKIGLVVSNLIFPLVGWTGDWVTFFAGLLLAVGSGWMHWNRTDISIKMDYIGMYALGLATVGFLTNHYLIILLVPIWFLFAKNFRDQYKVALIFLMACLIDQNIISILLFGVSYASRQFSLGTKWEKLGHIVFHIVAGIAIYMIYQ